MVTTAFTAFKLPTIDEGEIANAAARVEIATAAGRAIEALNRAIAEPSCSRHRVDLTNALNYIETIVRQEKA